MEDNGGQSDESKPQINKKYVRMNNWLLFHHPFCYYSELKTALSTPYKTVYNLTDPIVLRLIDVALTEFELQ